MRFEPLGDRAWILRDLHSSAAATANAIEAASLDGVTDVVPCGDTVGIYADREINLDQVLEAGIGAADGDMRTQTHRIPVCYEMGEDLVKVATHFGLSAQDFARRHAGATYQCFAIGFCPGFAYLGPLPPELRGVARMPTPRPRTQPGSLGITGNQTAVYPLMRPGGWPVIGRTPLELVNVSDGYFPISVGDSIRFEMIGVDEYARLRGSRL